MNTIKSKVKYQIWDLVYRHIDTQIREQIIQQIKDRIYGRIDIIQLRWNVREQILNQMCKEHLNINL